MGKFARTFSLMHASWEVLKQDKELLLSPLFSAVGCILVLASFVGLLGMAGSLSSFRVVPILVVENEGPIDFMVFSLPAVFIVIAGVVAGNLTLVILGVLAVILIALAQSALQGIFQAALHLYMRDGVAPEGFDASELRAAIG